MPLDAIRSVETFIISIPRDVPYLGPLKPGESVNPKGYIVRAGNRRRHLQLRRSAAEIAVLLRGADRRPQAGLEPGVMARQLGHDRRR